MKAIENISQKLEKILVKGFDVAESSIEIKLYQTNIKLYLIEGSIFVYFKHKKGTSNSATVNVYEIGPNESYYLYDTIRSIIDKISGYGEQSDKETALKVYKEVLDFCKNTGFESGEFEEALSQSE